MLLATLPWEKFIYAKCIDLFMWKDRREAGQKLAEELLKYKGEKDVLILAIPRGGVEVGFDVADRLKVPLSVVVTKKIPFPGQEELAIGAVDGDGEVVLDEEIVSQQSISNDYIKKEKERLLKEIKRRYKEFGGELDINGKTVIIVDDGIATGQTMRAAVMYIKRRKPKKMILAVPVASKDSLDRLEEEVDEIVCLWRADMMFAVGQFYDYFPQVEDEQVKKYLKTHKKRSFLAR